MAVRRQLSVMACIFVVGHIAFYAASYVPTIAATPTVNLALSLALATALVALMEMCIRDSPASVGVRHPGRLDAPGVQACQPTLHIRVIHAVRRSLEPVSYTHLLMMSLMNTGRPPTTTT